MSAVWTTRDGTKVLVADMGDEHLVNTLRMLKRNAIKRRAVKIDLSMAGVASLNGDMAQYYAEADVDRLLNSSWKNFLPPIWKELAHEAQKRGLKVPT